MKTFASRSLVLKKKSAAWLAMALLLPGLQGRRTAGQEKPPARILTANQVVEHLARMNSIRAQALRSYSSVREYHLVLNGIIHRRADMVAKMTYHWPGEKDFTIISESGSEIMRSRVLKAILQAEKDSMKEENQRQTALNAENYEFSLAGVEGAPQPTAYILNANPRVKNRFLFKGKIWVNAKDFAVTRIECEPARNPSWWTKRNDITNIYQKLGDFWLPAHTESLTEVRIFGHTELDIVYKDYDLMDARKLQGPSQAQGSLSSRSPAAAPLVR
ncbi:MAG TPA: hypothetical protein VG028_21075 [Terriglobia bacterium]|nr:hypothetical protein [Terriglobia bacterium]